MTNPQDYLQRTYAGVLGKLIGVYLGRPFEGWTYERIMAELGEITGYVHDRFHMPLIVTDDDISGTFTFLRAMPDYDNNPQLTPEQIGQTWLNYIIEQRTILWWGGLGNSTEHTAYLRLKNGIRAPHSGSIAVNGTVVAEQIGSQIFIDGWAMISPGDPERAADFARRAASVSHDGEAIYGAQVIAAMEAQAYVENDLNRLLDTALTFIPHDSVIYRMVGDIREWHAEYRDWRNTREQIAANYGYDKYGGNCHMVPNHGLIIMSLLHGGGDFGRSLMMVNTAGWDTDCNSGNIGCLLGIRNGLVGLESGTDWRTPIADRLYLPTADGGSAISDAVLETYKIVNIGRALAADKPLLPKNNARFHFELPGSVQGFHIRSTGESTAFLQNVTGYSQTGERSLALHFNVQNTVDYVSAGTPTFIPPDALNMPGYKLIASPTLYPGQVVHSVVTADSNNVGTVSVLLYVKYYGKHDQIVMLDGSAATVAAGLTAELIWRVPDVGGHPIFEIGIAVRAEHVGQGSVYLDYLTWDGSPDVILRRPLEESTLWRQAWVDATDQTATRWPEAYRVVQNSETGLLIQGTRDWTDYRITAEITPHLAAGAGIAARVQGLRRYYALLLRNKDTVCLVKTLDGEVILASRSFQWAFGQAYVFTLQVTGSRLEAWLNGELLFDLEDTQRPLLNGAVALVCEEGRIATEKVDVFSMLAAQ